MELSPLNATYLQKAEIQTAPAGVPKKEEGKQKEQHKKLKTALLALGIIGAAGIGIYALTRGKKAGMQEAIKSHWEVLENSGGRIKVCCVKEGIKGPTIELPEFLYHVTSAQSMEKITQSGTLKISQHEQLRGVYFIDSENFISKYPATSVNGTTADLMSGIFKHANRGNKGIPAQNQELVILKIPTQDLLNSGKIRVRTQEDFFTFQNAVKKYNKQMGTDYTLRGLFDDYQRASFKKALVSNNIKSEAQAEDFINRMTRKIHYGYSVSDAARLKLEQNNSVEYIFNKDIKLSDFPNMQTTRIKTADYFDPKAKTFDHAKIISLFRGL